MNGSAQGAKRAYARGHVESPRAPGAKSVPGHSNMQTILGNRAFTAVGYGALRLTHPTDCRLERDAFKSNRIAHSIL